MVATGCGGSGGSSQASTPTEPSSPATTNHTVVSTYHNDNARTGANITETLLTPANVNPVLFGKRAAITVAGDIFAQPLYIPAIVTAEGVCTT